ncbi:MAG: 6-phosphofructokinase [Phycisphaeraceae bacterium]|nr:MAG: 6-phosphofructokinase [Phycisphaeraceae bacterium]
MTARHNAIVAQGGGPTAVINQSLVGVIEGLRGIQGIDKIYGARHGVRGMVEERLVELQSIRQAALDPIARTPSAALGSTRDKPDQAYCQRVFESLKKHNIRSFFYIGGNDSSDTCRIINELAGDSGFDLRCFHVPKTVDNDLVENDHTPGYPSAARYVAMAFMGDNLDNASLPGIKINVVMGRHAGFLTAASALCRERETDGPHLVYCPEIPFDIERFAEDVQSVYSELGRCQIAVSEGIQNKDGEAIGATLIKGETDAHGNVQLSGSGALGDSLANYLKEALTAQGGKPPRIRADTLGYAQRCFPDPSPVDQHEAREAGRFAAHLLAQGESDGSVSIVRTSDAPYTAQMKRIDLTAIAAKTRHMPEEFFDGHNNVSKKFTDWLRPLVGPLPTIGWI